MKNKLTICVLICLMTLLVGCNSNTAKEAAQEKTKTETSFPAGNSEKQTQEATKEETEHIPVQESTPSANSKAEVSNPAQSKADESAAIPKTENQRMNHRHRHKNRQYPILNQSCQMKKQFLHQFKKKSLSTKQQTQNLMFHRNNHLMSVAISVMRQNML